MDSPIEPVSLEPVSLERIITLYKRFNQHRETHPTLYNLWVSALDECKLKLYYIIKTVEQGELLIEKLPNDVTDPNMSTIITLLSMLGSTDVIDDMEL